MSTLYLVATPIGNLEDLSPRAIRILKEVRLVAAEDTRRTAKLMTHFQIDTPSTSYYDHNKGHKTEAILNALEKGDVALVSDAGTPGLNDPGYLLVKLALEAGHTVSPIPGPSAPIAALVVSGLPTDHFLYLGYLPRKQGERKRSIEEVKSLPYTLIFFETPHRLDDSLKDLEALLGDRQVAVAGELTKMFEDVYRGTLSSARTHFQDHPARGEYTLVVAGQAKAEKVWNEEDVLNAAQIMLQSDVSPSQAARQLAEQSRWPRRKIYQILTRLQNQDPQT
jgi:16S rRNA (cytidine1402-2'-O)-methyltransferase